MANVIKNKRGTAAQWTSLNPILAEGELGLETDTLKIKFGDGVTAWNSLSYAGSTADLSNYYTKAEVDSLLENLESDFTPIEPLEFATVNPIGGYQNWGLDINNNFAPTGNIPAISNYQINYPTYTGQSQTWDAVFTEATHYIDVPINLADLKQQAVESLSDKFILLSLLIDSSSYNSGDSIGFMLCNNTNGTITPVSYLYTNQLGSGVATFSYNPTYGQIGLRFASGEGGSNNTGSGTLAPGFALTIQYLYTSDSFKLSVDSKSATRYSTTPYTITDASLNGDLETVNMVRVLTYSPNSSASFKFLTSSFLSINGTQTAWRITDQGEPTKELRCKYDDSTITLNSNDELQVNIPQVESSLTSFADTSFSNVTDTANILMAHNAMPSQTSIDITLGASGATYIAPADGYYCLHVNWQQSYSNIVLSNGNVVGYSQTGTQGASGGLAYVPVAKGDVLTVTYHSVSLNWFRFTYAKGSESEAS